MTTSQLAKELNLSRYTVSSILNGKARERKISQKLEEKVLAYVKKHGFHSNISALSIKGQYRNDIAIVAPYEMYHHNRVFFCDLVEEFGISKISFMTFYLGADNVGEVSQQIKLCSPEKIIYISPLLLSEQQRNNWKIIQKNFPDVPCLFYDFPFESENALKLVRSIDYVIGINRQDIIDGSVEYAKKLKYESIYIPGNIYNDWRDSMNCKNSKEFVKTYDLPKMQRMGYGHQTKIVDYVGNKIAEQIINKNLKQRIALYISNEIGAMAAIKCLKLAGIKVPENVGVLTLGRIPEMAYCNLTTWNIPHPKMYNFLSKWLNSPDIVGEVRLKPELIGGETMKLSQG